METLKIDKQIKNTIPELTKEEYEGLEKKIKKEGCREPLIVWKGTLIDGHNRYNICQKHNIEFKTTELTTLEKEINSKEDVINWIIANQLSRRNLTEMQKSYLRGKRYSNEKKRRGGDRKSNVDYQHLKKGNKLPKVDNHHSEKGTTRDILAKEYSVSADTIHRDWKAAQTLDQMEPQERNDILTGKNKVSKQSLVDKAKDKDIEKKSVDKTKEKLTEIDNHKEKNQQIAYGTHNITRIGYNDATIIPYAVWNDIPKAMKKKHKILAFKDEKTLNQALELLRKHEFIIKH